MLIIPVKDGENIDRALKRFKRKFDKTGTMRQLRSRQQFTKPSVKTCSSSKSTVHTAFARSRGNLDFAHIIAMNPPKFGGFFLSKYLVIYP